MNDEKMFQKLKAIHQEHLLQYWKDLEDDEKKVLLRQVELLNLDLLSLQQRLLQQPTHVEKIAIDPFLDFCHSGSSGDLETGRRLIEEGKVGCLLIAGGQGTRLGFDGPKGMYPITPLTKKSLFQFFAEKVIAASKKFDRPLSLAIMTSPLNDQITRDFFEANQFFGLQQQQISFFMQDVLPFLDQEGNLFLEEKGKIAMGPDGNGYSLKQFVVQTIWKKWHEEGIEFVNYVLIDNPLADPFDAELIGFHYRKQADVTLKCVQRRNSSEKVGIVVKQENKVKVIEYSEISQEERQARLEEGSLKHPCANVSLFCFNMAFIKKMANQILPLHKSLKKAKKWGQVDSFYAWKFETFIFDLLSSTNKVQALVYPREECFAPLKNSSGEDSILYVQQALENQAKKIYQRTTGQWPIDTPFELPMEYYYFARE